MGQRSLRREDWIPPLLLPQWNEAAFTAWLRRYQPDAIISKCAESVKALRRLGLRLPRDLGAAFLTGVNSARDLSGVNEAPHEVGAAAVDFLAGILQRGERGIPAQPRRLLIEGKWIEGTTVRKVM